MKRFDEAALAALRERVSASLSPYRFAHTAGVEKTVIALAALYVPEKTPLLRAAALLHDFTKEYTETEARAVFAAHGVTLRADEAASPKTWHAITAALLIGERFPAFADAELVSAVRWHTTGRAGMTLSDAILYLADYIEEGRRFDDCVALRRMFFDADPQAMTPAARRAHLCRVLVRSFELTEAGLHAEGAPVCLDTLAAKEYLQNTEEPFGKE